MNVICYLYFIEVRSGVETQLEHKLQLALLAGRQPIIKLCSLSTYLMRRNCLWSFYYTLTTRRSPATYCTAAGLSIVQSIHLYISTMIEPGAGSVLVPACHRSLLRRFTTRHRLLYGTENPQAAHCHCNRRDLRVRMPQYMLYVVVSLDCYIISLLTSNTKQNIYFKINT